VKRTWISRGCRRPVALTTLALTTLALTTLGLALGCSAGAVPERYALPPIDRLAPATVHGGRSRAAAEIDLIVVHAIGGPVCEPRAGAVSFSAAPRDARFWRDWFARQTDRSIHYVIDREGRIAAQRPEERTAGHVSYAGIVAGVNDRSVGIELVNRGDGVDPFPEPQIRALIALIQDIGARRGLDGSALRLHSELDDRTFACGDGDHRRNVDPGPLFPLERVTAAMGRARRD
jgi:N-acetylmuramoyl-L-alanine amidase